MKFKSNLFTSEAVSEGHPDKICDRIADAILDYALKHDPYSHSAIECFASTNILIIGGEVTLTNNTVIPYEDIARRVIKDIGYDKDEYGFNYQTVKIINLVKTQSIEINNSVVADDVLNIGAGDQGIMFGYASNETEGYMPLAISIAQKLVRVATNKRKNGEFKGARPDMKSQVTIDYTNPVASKVVTVLMAIQHDPNIDIKAFKKYAIDEIIMPTLKSFKVDASGVEILINTSGSFTIGGPMGDTGLTGRKIIVDTYGGASRHGGGSFSGKDPTKVDRSASYMARYIAKNLVASGVAKRLEVQLSYAIGKKDPISVSLSTFSTSNLDDEKILNIISKVFDLRVGAIIQNFSLRCPTFKYEDIANYGHFGRPDIDLPYEKLDKVEEIKSLLD